VGRQRATFVRRTSVHTCEPPPENAVAVGLRTSADPEHEGNEVTIGTRSMAEFGLTYEGYDLPRDVYISDSGGKLKVVADTPGRAGRSRAELGESVPYRHVVGILTHPCWWDLDHPKPRRREDVGYAALLRRLTGEESSRFSSLRRRFGRRR
jgi:hypothetical protein